MKKIFLITILLIISNQSFAQYGGILAGIEFSKPLFSDYSNAKSGYMFGFFYNGIINKKELNYQIEFTLNQYREYLKNKFSGAEYSLLEEESNTYLTLEATALFEVPEIFANHFPNFLLGFSAGYCVEDDYSSNIIGEGNETSLMVTDSERSPLPIIFGINTGLSYDLKPVIISLRYKLSNIILDDRNFMQDFYIVINLKL